MSRTFAAQLFVLLFVVQAGITCDHNKVDSRLLLPVIVASLTRLLRAGLLCRFERLFDQLMLQAEGILHWSKYDTDGKCIFPRELVKLLSECMRDLYSFVSRRHYHDIIASYEQDIERKRVSLHGE